MIVDVDTLTRRFGSSIAMHCKITSIMSSRDILSCPQAHDTTNLSSHTADKLSQPPATVNTQLILSSTLINSLFTGSTLSVQTTEPTHVPTAAPSLIAIIVNNAAPSIPPPPTIITPALDNPPSLHISSSPILYTSGNSNIDPA